MRFHMHMWEFMHSHVLIKEIEFTQRIANKNPNKQPHIYDEYWMIGKCIVFKMYTIMTEENWLITMTEQEKSNLIKVNIN